MTDEELAIRRRNQIIEGYRIEKERQLAEGTYVESRKFQVNHMYPDTTHNFNIKNLKRTFGIPDDTQMFDKDGFYK